METEKHRGKGSVGGWKREMTYMEKEEKDR